MEKGEPSAEIRRRVIGARRVQQERFKKSPRVHCNAAMRAKDVHKHCPLEDDARQMLKMAMSDLNFSARAYDRILKVSRTIADLDSSEAIKALHVQEAIQYRSLDRQYWA